MLKLGKSKSNSELLEGRKKLEKDYVCENPCILEDVLHGNNPDNNEEFLTALVTTMDGEPAFVGIPVTSMDVFNTITEEDVENTLSKGNVLLYMEKKRNRKGTRDYYIAWMDLLNK